MVAALGRVSLAGAADKGKSSDNFVMAGGEALTVGLTPYRLIEIALAEDKRRMNRYDPRLLRPQIVPFIGRLVLKILPKG